MYSARLTRQKPKINDTKDYAKLIVVDLADTFFLQKSISNNDQLLAWTSSDFLAINLSSILAPILSNHLIKVQTIITISGINLSNVLIIII